MVYKILQIARDVRIAIDQNMTSEQLIATDDIETLSLEEIIRSKIVEAVRRVETAAPVQFWKRATTFRAVYIGMETEVAGYCCPTTSCVL